ncbi:thioredoxin family protein [Rickettsiella grylli]|uniref:Redoxin superfamily n=1 Tax=Rickettsiella grylli TaxID=59196 RepID=A8PQ50_9COXI|nr:thioredoxin family protein [Rickettsiella grylli]EDP45657.1 redoxin superfamily [Rickettsiella grylli]EDP46631.1 redoxin superfamily [Rickettsiella grylli]
MTLTPSRMLPLGTKAPDFTLQDTLTSKPYHLFDHVRDSKATVIMFICNHCPFVKHVIQEIIRLAKDYQAKGISFIAISANDALNYPEDAPHKMTQLGKLLNFSFPYLYDETQSIAKAYHATCTPDFFIFDKNLLCVYRGQFDDSRPSNKIPVTGKDIRSALENILKEKLVNPHQLPSMGCNIKWK